MVERSDCLAKGDELMEATLEKIRSLEQIYVEGYEDSFLDNALQKIISHQLARDQADLQVLQQDLAELERQYGISSEEFYERFQAGQMSDEADFMEWNALYKMAAKLRTRLGILQGQGI
jgi:hypothetical protein